MEHLDAFSWVVLPLIIFGSRVCDVTLGTLRHVFVSRGMKNITPILGFFEVLIWIVVIRQVMNQANNWACFIAWAGGFATGNYVGMRIEERLALGLQVIRIITNQDCAALLQKMKATGHGFTLVDGKGAVGPVKVIFTIVKRKDVNEVAEMIAQHNPSAFYSVEDVRDTASGVFRKGQRRLVIRMIFPGK